MNFKLNALREQQQEIILCAAIHFATDDVLQHHQPINITTGMVLCGHRHACIFGQYAGMFVKDRRDIGITELSQGFLTNKNRYVEREEAAIIARDAGQLTNITHDWSKVKDDEWGTFHARLFSEDLY